MRDRINTAARKSELYWQTRRADMNLLKKAKRLDEVTISAIKEELQDILDSGILTYPHTLYEQGLHPKQSYNDKKYILGIKTEGFNHGFHEKKFIEDMANKANESRRTNWAWRIGQEAEEKQMLGWHPFFVTLTVDPMLEDPARLWKEGREFRKYIRELANIVCGELGHPAVNKTTKKFPNYRSESEYVTYCGVIEHGKSRLHHHGHFIIWLRAVPPTWRACPNRSIRNPAARTNNECVPLSAIWGWSQYTKEGKSLSPALYFRSVGDIWESEYKFALPIKEGQPMKVSGPKTAGRYITKYLTKEFKEWHHRMKCTRNLGMKSLKALMETLEPAVIKALTWRAETSSLNHSLMMTHSLPLGLLRQEAKRMHYLNLYRSKQLDLKMLLTSNIGVFQRMLSSVRSGQRPYRMNSKDFYDWVGKFLPDQDGYCDKALIAAHVLIGQVFPRDKMKVKHRKLGGNEIGRTSRVSNWSKTISSKQLQVHGFT